MTPYQRAIVEATLELPDLPYNWSKEAEYGCPTDIYAHGKRLMVSQGGDRPGVYCSGITSWILFRAWEKMGILTRFPFEVLEELRQFIFCSDWETKGERLLGGPYGLVDLKLGRIIRPEDMQLGDLVQYLWHPVEGEGARDGHSGMGLLWEPEQAWIASANLSSDEHDHPGLAWSHGHLPESGRSGTGYQWFSKRKPGRSRITLVGRFNPDMVAP